MTTIEILKQIVDIGASDLFIIAGRPLSWRLHDQIVTDPQFDKLMPGDTSQLVKDIYELAGRDITGFMSSMDDDFSFALPGVSRFRVNAFMQRNSMAAVIRIITFTLPKPEEMHIPANVMDLCNLNKGLVLVTGTAGSGKSTTLACMIDQINHTRQKHIITLEDPLEYLHRHDKSIVSQREIHTDTTSYVASLRAALRQSPDVILLGEMRDYETMQVAMTAAETGHLVFSTLHTVGATSTIDRIIDVFPANQQKQIAIQLSTILQAVISQQLLPSTDGTLIPAFEIMTLNPAIRNMIREHKIPQLEGLIYSSQNNPNMVAMDTSLYDLYINKKISMDTALEYATNPPMLRKKMK